MKSASPDRKDMWIALGIAAVLTAGVLLLVWPNYREVAGISAQIANLRTKIDTLSTQTDLVESLAREVNQSRRRIESELREIPDSAGVADLMRELSLPIDGANVADQTFTAGSATGAIPGEEAGPLRMPLTVDITGTFDSVFSLVHSAESMRRLVRVSSVRIARGSDDQESDVPLLKATIGLDAIYLAPQNTENP